MWINPRDDGTTLTCRVQPGASRNSIEGIREDQLLVKLCAPPVEGKANAALIKLFSKKLHIAKSRLQIVRGETSRTKTLFVSDFAPEQVMQALGIEEEIKN